TAQEEHSPTDPPTSEDPPEEEPTDDSPSGENLFEGTWGFGHDSKVLSAEELSALLEQEAEARGPEEMSLSVECGDGVDTGAGDDAAVCIACADVGGEHLWAITVGPADAGLEIEVENIGCPAYRAAARRAYRAAARRAICSRAQAGSST